ncbi:glycogen/starch/alpha-glucan phosphorylase [Brotaphodocola catenula]|uniref:Alpha-1,4 glucan phosphorylase n=1 Tax=Brotaphodocola catenula TaxID=2885361 RepID=A0AAE3API5_9FIRM|nr:glycogen/starch/alpha-glucan phosphorylase [Brotaphodocola catenula]MCC2165478.1 glycogen/starch/alpha-glucan family phosphorylase [Brotaphodocola catenula]
MNMTETLQKLTGKSLADCTNQEIYLALLDLIRENSAKKATPVTGRKLYYISAEFLIGKLLSNNLINLGLYDEVRTALADAGKSLSEIEEVEPEPSLGNGGLGRLAACFLDSLATLNLPGDGIGLRYHFGLFHQQFKDNLQNELPDPWLTEHSWAEKTDITYPVKLAGKSYTARLYKLAVTGYEGRTNTLNLFDLDTIDESIVEEGISFDKTAIAKNLTLFLYPDDSDEAGRLLRVYQQYMMVSAGAQLVLAECVARGCNYHDLADYAAIQINDTHPSMVIPELIRLLGEHGIKFEEAVEIVTATCAYTNHTILAEALEKWPRAYLDKVVPQLMPIIEKLDELAGKRTKDKSLAIIDKDDRVHMAHMDIHFTHSTNGVAALHTEILEESELHGFYELYPEKFNNKTNGITFRRWLLECNPALAEELESLIGSGFRKNADELEKLLTYADDENVLNKLTEIKSTAKKALADWLLRTQGVTVNPEAMFDIQSKRLHEYKRQQLNLLYLIHQYCEIKAGHLPPVPLVSIFGAKAAPAYIIAKDIIHALLALSEVIANDPAVSPWLQVVFVENYNVTAAEKLIPACDLSEQISLASKEASGTGNMKFMLNGALTLGTMDGANVEISQRVGNDNIYIFGQTSNQVIHRYELGDYKASEWYEGDPNLRRAIDFLTSKEMLSAGHEENLNRLQHELISKDWFQTLPDFNAYVVRKGQALANYALNPTEWRRRCLVNIAMAGFFSSDRTIAEYNKDIWKLGK